MILINNENIENIPYKISSSPSNYFSPFNPTNYFSPSVTSVISTEDSLLISNSNSNSNSTPLF